MIETAYPHEIPKLTAEEQEDLCTITDLLAKHKNKNFRDAVAHDMYMYNDLDAMIIGALKLMAKSEEHILTISAWDWQKIFLPAPRRL